MNNRFVAKVIVSPSGLVKVSEGLGMRRSVRSAILPPSALSIVPNFKDSFQPLEYDPLPPPNDCPVCSPLKIGYGLLGHKKTMSAKSAKNLRERMCSIELEYGIEKCLFSTLTLPSDNIHSYEMIARYSAYLVNRLNVWIADNYKYADFARCGVWEYQKRGALHYHFLLGSHCMDAISLDEFRYDLAKFWMSALEAVESESGESFFSQKGEVRDKSRLLEYKDLGKRFANVQVVEKSVCAYLSGYLSGSNHDNKKDKNGLRKKLFPVATWAQWNRKATQLFKKYSIECEKIIWANDYDSWQDLKDILFAAIEKAEGTNQLDRHNPFWKSTMIIAKEKGLSLLENINDWLGMIEDSGIVSKLFSVVKFSKKSAKEEKDLRLAQYEHDEKIADWNEYLMNKDRVDNFGQNIANKMNEFLLNMLLWERDLERHLKLDRTLDCPLFTYKELQKL